MDMKENLYTDIDELISDGPTYEELYAETLDKMKLEVSSPTCPLQSIQ